MTATVTQAAKDAHARYEAKRRGKPFTPKPADLSAAAPKRNAPTALRRSAPAAGGTAAPRPAFAAVKRRIAALGKEHLNGTEAASLFNTNTFELLSICKFSQTPNLHDVGQAKRFSAVELLAWAKGGFMFGQPGDTSLAGRQKRFIERTARDETRAPSKKLTARIASSHAASTAKFGAK